MKHLYLAFILLFFASCTPKDPNPELQDPIYIDLSKELDLTKKNIEQIEKELEDRQLLLQKVVPQSGQLKTIEKKVFESQNYLQKLKQQKQFFEIKADLRKNYVGNKYLDSFKGGAPWPDTKEIEIYNSSLKFNRDKIGYEKNKGVVKNVPRGTNDKKPAEKPPQENAEE